MKKIGFKIIFAFLGLPSVVAGTLYFLNAKGFFNLDQIEIQVSESQSIIKYLEPLKLSLNSRFESYRGTSLWNLDLKKMSQALVNQRWIESFKMTRIWPQKVQISIVPKDIVFMYIGKNGEMLPVVSDGSFLPVVHYPAVPDVAIATGATFEKNSEMRKKVVKIIKSLPPEGLFSSRQIAEIQYDGKEGFWATLIQSGVRVKMGDESKMDLKAQRVSQVLNYLGHRGLEAKIIDADLSKKVLVRLKKKADVNSAETEAIPTEKDKSENREKLGNIEVHPL